MTKELNDKLLTAADDGDYITVCEVVEAGADVNAKCSMGWTALICASRRDEYADSPLIVKILLENKADINAVNQGNETALMRAVEDNKELRIAKILLDAGADINVSDHCGRTVLHSAIRKRHTNFVKLLIEKGANIDFWALWLLAINDYFDIASSFIKSGADLNKKSEYGDTLLMKVCKEGGKYHFIKLLLENGADVNLQDSDGKTPLMRLNQWKSLEISKLLIESGADVNLKDKCGTTALMQKCQDARHDSAKLLIDAGADVNAKNNKGQTALMLACIKGRYNNSINLLLENGADINAQDNEGNTALMLAGVNEEVETVKLLLSFEGVDAALKNKRGDTVLMMVVHYALAHACNYEDECGDYENYDYNNNKETPNLNYIKIIKLLEDHIINN